MIMITVVVMIILMMMMMIQYILYKNSSTRNIAHKEKCYTLKLKA